MKVEVVGTPAPQGSKRAIVNRSGKVSLIESSDGVKPWRAAVVAAWRQQIGKVPPLAGPVSVHIVFRLARPKHHWGTGRNAELLKPGAPFFPTGKPDLDKLSRACLDALKTAGAYGDDAQVIALHAVKHYISPGQSPGATIEVTPL